MRACPLFVILAAMGAASLPGSAALAGSDRAIYKFEDSPDGALPLAGLTELGGLLYGTTSEGGQYEGIVFSLTPKGEETVLHRFGQGGDGEVPISSLIVARGTLYGTTGVDGNSTVYSITPDGTEKVLYSFKGASDGLNPLGVIHVKGKLYGTTANGGNGTDCVQSCGTVFSLTFAGVKNTLYSFQNGSDGGVPGAGLTEGENAGQGGPLYGTTLQGGFGFGVVFSVSLTGQESVVYAFRGGADGASPNALIRVGQSLYGTTQSGGTFNSGTIFKLSVDGTHDVIYSFRGNRDGANPVGSLLNLNGTLYGMTNAGGTAGMGTVFSLSPGRVETVLHSFTGGLGDGAQPVGGLTYFNKTLFGATFTGGLDNCSRYPSTGCGVVFKLKP